MSSGASLLASLLPPGRAFSAAVGSALWKLFSGLGAELDRVALRARDLREEADPRTAAEMLPEWERALGLKGSAGSIVTRERTAAALFAMRGGQSVAYIRRVATAVGYPISISEYPDFEPPPINGIALSEEQKQHCFRVVAIDGSVIAFTVGMKVGQPLRTYGTESVDLQALISALKPAHTYAVIAYSE